MCFVQPCCILQSAFKTFHYVTDISLLKNLGLGRGYKPNACFFCCHGQNRNLKTFSNISINFNEVAIRLYISNATEELRQDYLSNTNHSFYFFYYLVLLAYLSLLFMQHNLYFKTVGVFFPSEVVCNIKQTLRILEKKNSFFFDINFMLIVSL